MAKGKKPAQVVVEPVYARAVRGPHKDGSGRWYWQGVVYQGEKGNDRTVWSGWARRDELPRILADLIVNEGLDSKPAEDEGAPVETLRDLLETWVHAQEQRVDLSETWRRSARRSGSRLCSSIGAVRLDEVDRATLEGYRNRALRTESNPDGIAPATCLQDMKMLRAAWAWGQELGLVSDRPLPRVSVKVVGVKDKRTPTREEILAVLAQLDEGWPRLAVLLLAATGARIAEVARLTWADVDLEAGTLTIRPGEGRKTGGRTVPVGAGVVAELRQWMPRERTPAPTEGLFGVSWKLIRSKLGTGPLERACKAAGVEKFTPHGMRRAAVDAFLDASVNPKVAGAILGQSDVVMLKYYAQASERKKREALLAARLDVEIALDAPNREEPEDVREEIPTVTASRPKPVQRTRTNAGPRNTKPLPDSAWEGQVAHPREEEPQGESQD